MGTHKKRLFSILLILALLPSLTACGEKEPQTDAELEKILFQTAPAYKKEEISLPVDTGYLQASCTDSRYIYFAVDQTEAGEAPNYVFCRGDLESGEVSTLENYQLSESASEADVYTIVGIKTASDGNLWSLDWWSIPQYDLPEDFNETEDDKLGYLTERKVTYALRQLDGKTAKPLKETDISEAALAFGRAQITGWAVDGKGNLYLSTPSAVTVLDSAGQQIFALEAVSPDTYPGGSAGGTLATLSNGAVAALTVLPDKTRQVRTIDPATQDWGAETYKLSANAASQIYSGSGPYLFYYLENDSVFGWVEQENGARKLLSWSSAGISGNAACFAPLADNAMAALTRKTVDGTDQIGLLRLQPTDQREDGRTVLTYGTIHLQSALQFKINKFNEENENYFIEVHDYAEGLGRGRDARDNARKRLFAEIAAGRTPDIMGGEWMPLDQFASKGMLEDLWPYIESDPELGRERVMEHVLECTEVDGKLYQIGCSFGINTLMASRSVVGDRTSWTFDELLDAYNTLPEGSTILDVSGYHLTGQETLIWLMCQDRYVDWSTWTCRFDSEDFIELLKLCARVEDPETDSETVADDAGAAIREGRQLLTVANLIPAGSYASLFDGFIGNDIRCGGPSILRDYDEEVVQKYGLRHWNYDYENRDIDGSFEGIRGWTPDLYPQFSPVYLAGDCIIGTPESSGYAAYPGYPTESGSGGYFSMYENAAISTTCKDKDGAWEFLRQKLLPGGNVETNVGPDGSLYTSTSDYPMNKEDFDKLVAQSMEPKWCLEREKYGEKVTGFLLDENGEPIEAPISDIIIGSPAIRMVVPVMASMGETYYEQFMSLYNSIDRFNSNDDVIRGIVEEMTGPFFAGDKSAEETAKQIQSRVQLYLDELR